MGGDTEDVSVQRLPSVWAYAACVLVSFVLQLQVVCKCHITSDSFSSNFPVYYRNDNTGIVGLLTIH